MNYKDYFYELEDYYPEFFFDHKKLIFTPKEIDILKKLLLKSDGLHLYANPKGKDLKILNSGKSVWGGWKELCKIYKSSNEYYYLVIFGLPGETKLFKCDQIDGLIKCIEIIILN